MATGDQFLNPTDKRILGVPDFKDRLIDYLRKVVSDIHDVAFGLDGVFGGSVITISAFGANAIQLDIDATCSDGDGHFLRTDAALAGRTSGLAFENTNTVLYYIGLHYAERPRGVQINPRNSFPEFLAMEETIGERADPNSVTDNGSNLTFRVDAVAQPFGGAVDTHAGRRCLVWKKQPGGLAITEGLAVEECTVAFVGGENRITTTGLLGQTVGSVSLNASDYFVLMLGPTISSSTNLELQAGYTFIGTVTGNGGTPTVFSTTGQNALGSGFAVDLNAITRLDSHGDLKIRVGADASDVNEPQVEVQSSGGNRTFWVDEDGTAAVDGPDFLTATPRSQTPRFDARDNNAASWIRWGRTWRAAGLDIAIWMDADNGRIGFSVNCVFDETTNQWSKNITGLAAHLVELQLETGLLLRTRFAANNTAWTDSSGWDASQTFHMPLGDLSQTILAGFASARLRGVSTGNPGGGIFGDTSILRLGELSEDNLADGHAHPRIRANAVDNGGNEWTLLLWFGAAAGAVAPTGDTRFYLHRDGTIAVTKNAVRSGTQWDRDVAASRFRIRLGEVFSFETIASDLTGLQSESAWQDLTGYLTMDGTALSSGGSTGPALGPVIRLIFGTMRLASAVGVAEPIQFDEGTRLRFGDPVVSRSPQADGDIEHNCATFDAGDNFIGLRRVAPATSEAGYSEYYGRYSSLMIEFNKIFNGRRNPGLIGNILRDDASAPTVWTRMIGTAIETLDWFLNIRGGSEADSWDGASGGIRLIRLLMYSFSHANGGAVLAQMRGGRIQFDTPGIHSNPPASTALANTALAKNQVKGWAIIDIVAGVASLREGLNVSSVANNGQEIDVFWASAFTNNHWGAHATQTRVVGDAQSHVPVTFATEKWSTTNLRIEAYLGTNIIDCSAAGSTFSIFVTAYGIQA